MITQIIFIESTIEEHELLPYIGQNTLVLPSIKRGDLIRSISQNPQVNKVIIVDGIFEHAPAITHKEILWVIQKDIKVIGISSMGALRAAELYNVGMQGYGLIYNYYLSGDIDGDDEVGISFTKHQNKIYKTIPLINLRQTIIKYFEHKDALILIDKLRSINYRERTWPKIKRALENDQIYNFLQKHYIDQKKQDVINYFSKFNNIFIREKSKKSDIKTNIFFKDLYFRQLYNSDREFLQRSLESFELPCNHQLSMGKDSIIVDAVLKLLELKPAIKVKVDFLLNQLSHFEYTKEVSLKNLKKLLQDRSVTETDLKIIMHNIQLDAGQIIIVSGAILKLLKYFKFYF